MQPYRVSVIGSAVLLQVIVKILLVMGLRLFRFSRIHRFASAFWVPSETKIDLLSSPHIGVSPV